MASSKKNSDVLSIQTRPVQIAIVVRLLSGPLIFFSPVFATFLNIVLDAFDGELFKRSGYTRPQYSVYDKILDYYWYVWIIFYIIGSNALGKYVFLALFIYRTIGQVLFLLFNKGFILFLFPNIFEKMFYYYLAALLLHKEPILMSPQYLAVATVLCTLFALFIEYIVHIKRVNLSGTYLGKTTYWPLKNIHPYKAFIVISLFLSMTVILNQFTQTTSSQSISAKASYAKKNGQILSYDPQKGTISGTVVYAMKDTSVDGYIFSFTNRDTVLCTKNHIQLSPFTLNSTSLVQESHKYLFAFSLPCLTTLPDGSYLLFLIHTNNTKDMGVGIEFTIQNSSLKR